MRHGRDCGDGRGRIPKSQLNLGLNRNATGFGSSLSLTRRANRYDPLPRVITPATATRLAKTFMAGDQEYSRNYGESIKRALTLRDAPSKVERGKRWRSRRVYNRARHEFAAKSLLPKPQKSYLAMALVTHEATPLQYPAYRRSRGWKAHHSDCHQSRHDREGITFAQLRTRISSARRRCLRD